MEDDAEQETRKERREKPSGSADLFIIMEGLHDKLKLLSYEAKFCKSPFKPIPRHYFAFPANGSEQLHYFSNLFSWLLSLAGITFKAPDQYEDPNTVCANIVAELKKQGTPVDFSPSRLRLGSGEEVCLILNSLATNALKAQRFKYEKPIFPVEDTRVDAPQTPGGGTDVTGGNVVTPDEIEDETYEDDDDALNDADTNNKLPAESLKEREVMTAVVDPTIWRMEVERVLPQLKVHLRPDVKDWRSHLEHMSDHNLGIQSSLTETKVHLDKLHNDIGRTLEKNHHPREILK